MSYETVTIYYMSGTGNTYRVATWMGAAAQESGAGTRIAPFESANPAAEVKRGKDHLMGVLFPTHGFTAPWHIIKFALRLPRGEGTHAFAAATRAGTRIFRIFFPGLEGTAAYLVALILALKGYSVRGARGIDMPSNWISFHWGMRIDNVRAIINRNEPVAARFIVRILSGRRCFASFLPLALGILLVPISLGYLVMGRFYLAKLFFANGACNSCGLCVKNCPRGAVIMKGAKRPRPYWTYTCESCMRCMGYCPTRAIEAGHSLGVILYYVTIPVVAYALTALTVKLPWIGHFNDFTGQCIVGYPYILFSVWLTYHAFYYLVKIPAFNSLFTYTTFTRVYRRYHEPDTRLKDIAVGRNLPRKDDSNEHR